MLTIDLPMKQIAELEKLASAVGRKLEQEVAVAINKTAKKTRTNISKEVRTELAAPAKAVNKTLNQIKKATKSDPSAVVQLQKTRRIPLRDFGARQTRAGVSYKISKSRGRNTVSGAFQGPKPGVMKASWRGNVFKRIGKKRLPIMKLMGPSPWGVFADKKMDKPTVKAIQKELRKQIEERIRFNKLKASGAI